MTKDYKNQEQIKTFLGMPMRWEAGKILKGLWDPEDNRIFPPKYFGDWLDH